LADDVVDRFGAEQLFQALRYSAAGGRRCQQLEKVWMCFRYA